MTKGTSLKYHLTVFKKIIFDLQTIEVKYDEEDLGLILLRSLPSSYATFRDTILYSRDTLTLEEAYYALFSKENMKQLMIGYEDQAKDLVVQGRTQERILVVMRGANQIPIIKTKPTCDVRKRSTSNLNAISCKIRIRKLLQIRKENNQKIPVKPVLKKISTMMENSQLFLMATPNLARIGFLILVTHFIRVLIGTSFQHMKQCPMVLCRWEIVHLIRWHWNSQN